MILALALAAAVPTLTDATLVQRAIAPYDRDRKMNTREVLGRWRGRAVWADYPCSDLCPNYTVRIVHLDLAGAACRSAGGREVEQNVPTGIASMPHRFCVPAPLATPALLRRVRGS